MVYIICLIYICNQFAKNNHAIFNTMKTICIQYGDAVKLQECDKLNDTRLSWGGGGGVMKDI